MFLMVHILRESLCVDLGDVQFLEMWSTYFQVDYFFSFPYHVLPVLYHVVPVPYHVCPCLFHRFSIHLDLFLSPQCVHLSNLVDFLLYHDLFPYLYQQQNFPKYLPHVQLPHPPQSRNHFQHVQPLWKVECIPHHCHPLQRLIVQPGMP